MRLKDTTSNQIIVDQKQFYYGYGYYPKRITIVFQNSAYHYMDHGYDLTAFLVDAECNANGGGEPQLRADDMKARRMTAVYGKTKSDGFMHYIFNVEMEVVK